MESREKKKQPSKKINVTLTDLSMTFDKLGQHN